MGVRYRKLIIGLLFSGALSELTCCGTSRRLSRVPGTPPHPAQAPGAMSFTATAYSGGTQTASGTRPHQGIVAADPAVLPLDSHIRVDGAGAYSGEYVVRDTGGKIRGRKIDIYLPKHVQAKRFGRRRVTVHILRYGHVQRHSACTHHCRKFRHHRR